MRQITEGYNLYYSSYQIAITISKIDAGAIIACP